MAEDEEIYLGDGIYFLSEDYRFRLRVPRETGQDIVYLEPIVLTNLIRVLAKEEGWRNLIKDIVK
jgi:hypothetical protein